MIRTTGARRARPGDRPVERPRPRDGAHRRARRAIHPTLLAGALTACLALGALFARGPLVNGVTGEDVVGARLVRPLGYVLAAPLSNVLDTLALLSTRQHVALLAGLFVLFALWRVVHRRRRQTRLRALAGELLALAPFLAVVFALYAASALLPRPQARLALSDPEELAVDFHSHTRFSHDGMRWFTVERNRAWHRALGFDVAYVTDHDAVGAAAEERAGNPRRAGAGVTLLSGVELRAPGEHPVLLGVTSADNAAFQEGELKAGRLPEVRARRAAAVPVIFTLPGEVEPGRWPVRPQAFEIVDPTPRGLGQLDRDRARLVHVADSLGIALVASTNNHGWQAPGVGWNVMRIPGWRALSPAELDRRIRQRLHDGGPGVVRVVGRRRVATAASLPGQALTLPAVGWNLLRTLSWPERAAWVAWIWLAWIASARGRAAPAGAPGAGGEAAEPIARPRRARTAGRR